MYEQNKKECIRYLKEAEEYIRSKCGQNDDSIVHLKGLSIVRKCLEEK